MAVKDAFDTHENLNSVHNIAFLKFSDDYGNDEKKPTFTFDFNRALFKRINWDRMNEIKFLKIAPNFTFSRWIQEKVATEM